MIKVRSSSLKQTQSGAGEVCCSVCSRACTTCKLHGGRRGYLPVRSKPNMKGWCGPGGGAYNEDGLSSAVGTLTHISSLLEARRGTAQTGNNSRIRCLRRVWYIEAYSQASTGTTVCELYKLEGILENKEAFKSPRHSFLSTSRSPETRLERSGCRGSAVISVQPTLTFSARCR